MFQRTALYRLVAWSKKKDRKPLVLRGARQVGKTTLVKIFAENFEQFIYLNLEKKEDCAIFEQNNSIETIIEAIFFLKDKQRNLSKTLLFIDEIQESSAAVEMLRYFYEEYNELYVIAAGSLLETLIDKSINFPVGRVEFMLIRPFSFTEFLSATQNKQSLKLLETVPLPDYAHDKLLKLFNTYLLIGGMPEIIKNFAENTDLVSLKSIYESLITNYIDDIEKYAGNNTQTQIISHILRNSFYSAAERIKFEGFANSNYRSREVGECFRILEKTMFLQLVYPVTTTKLPALPDFKKSPKIQLLDTGLVNYFANIQKELFGTNEIESLYAGRIAEHITGQEIMALFDNPLYKLNFWSRESKDSNSELDFIYIYNSMLIPIEVKAGVTGRLRSLMQFIDMAEHPYAVRIYSGKLLISKETTLNGKPFYLLNLPFYLINKIENYIAYMIEN